MRADLLGDIRMNKLPIQNIANIGSKIFLFCREPDNSLKIVEDSKFMPYYFQESLEGAFSGFDGTKLTRIDCHDPSDMRKQRNEQSWSSDLNYIYRYLIDKVDEILPSNPRIIFFDIEVQCTDLPQPKETQTANDPISTIVIYDNYVKKYKTFFIKDYKSEFDMLDDFCKTIKELKCDCLAGWNCKDFDYCYLYYRYPDFPKKISPIGMSHWRNGMEMPAGISLVDMTGMDVKFTLQKRDSYKLNNVAHEDLGTELWEDEDFMDIEMSKKKCLEDVKKLVGLNDKNKYFEFFNSIRIFSKTTWEDQPAEYKNYSWQSLNSKPWDILFYQIAKKLNVILPNKPNYDEFEREEFKTNVFYKKDGAYRDTFQKGIFFDCLKVDLGSCYPRMIIDFNLDNANIRLQKNMPSWFPSEDEIAENINKGYLIWSQTKWGQYLIDNNIIPVPIYFRETKEELMKRKEYKDNFPKNWKELRWICYYKQNPNTITPQAFDSPMKWKQELKNKLKEASIETSEGKSIESAYKSCKGFNNSGFGSFGNIYTRLFNLHIFNTVTCLPRDLLHFLEDKLNRVNIQIIFIDTDSFVLNTTDITIVDKLNDWIIEWAMNKYNNQNVNVVLEYEGIFKQLYVGSKCRYIGMLEKPNGEIETEKKGLQLVRRDYEKFVKDFQTVLIKQKLWEKHSKEEIIEWIKEQIKEFKNAPLQDISFPCKINKPREDYKTSQPYFEAIDETQKLNNKFKKGIGDKFWWLYMSEPRVLAFDKENQEHIDRTKIDWSQMIEKCIFNLLIPIFKSLSWEEDLLKLSEEYGIILGSQYRNELTEELDNKDELKIKYSAREVKKRMNEKLGIVKPEKKISEPKPKVSKKIVKNKQIKKVDKSISSENWKIDNSPIDNSSNVDNSLLYELKKRGLV
jgi:DNA polymerase elongation subunit (family B)